MLKSTIIFFKSETVLKKHDFCGQKYKKNFAGQIFAGLPKIRKIQENKSTGKLISEKLISLRLTPASQPNTEASLSSMKPRVKRKYSK